MYVSTRRVHLSRGTHTRPSAANATPFGTTLGESYIDSRRNGRGKNECCNVGFDLTDRGSEMAAILFLLLRSISIAYLTYRRE